MSAPWWSSLYDERLAEVLLVREDDRELQATIAFLERVLEVVPGARLFDQCCGIGSLSIPLAQRGYALEGVDLIESYIARAHRDAEVAGVSLGLRAADAFTYTPPQPCDGAFNWWTSFGYADDDTENLRMLERAYEALVPGGRFALDTMNVPGVLRGFQRDVVRERQTPSGPVHLWRRTALDLAEGRMHKVWTYVCANAQTVEHRSSVKLYMPHDLVAMMRSVGFGEVRLLGDLDGTPLGLDSPRCIVVGRRPR